MENIFLNSDNLRSMTDYYYNYSFNFKVKSINKNIKKNGLNRLDLNSLDEYVIEFEMNS
jgi:hypothetical protein